MLRKFISLIFLGTCFSASAQDLKGLHFGVSISPFQYWYSNKYIYNNPEKTLKSNNKILNGFKFGFNTSYYFNNNWGIKTGLDYSIQQQNVLKAISSDSGQTFFFNSNNNINTKLNYLHLPLVLCYNYQINENFILLIEQGTQLSILESFKYNYQNADLNNNIVSILTYTNNYTELKDILNPSNSYKNDDVYNPYNKVLIGYVGKIGLKYGLNDKLFINSELFFNYDFTNTDRENITFKNSPTHNIRAGIELGISYKLEKKCNCSE